MIIQKTFDDIISSKIKCEICGKEFGIITSTHLKKHGMSIQEYREQFPDASLVPDGFKRKLLERRKQMENRDINTILKREREQDIHYKKELIATIKQKYIEFIKRCKPVSIKITPPLDEDFDWHHVDKNHVVAAPRKLHRAIRHRLSKKQSMIKINSVINQWYKTNCGFEFLPLKKETLESS